MLLQVQTIDSCNARCEFCPSWQIKQTGKIIDDYLFSKIVSDFSQINKNENLKIALYLRNEPLIDKEIFNRIRFIKNNFRNSTIEIVTNGLLLPRFEKEDFSLISCTVEIGESLEDYNNQLSININQEKYNEINEIVDKKNINKGNRKAELIKNKSSSSSFYSRAGFLTGDKILHKEIKGCNKYKRNDVISVTYDGKFTICCMDYRDEVIFGDFKTQSIREILESSYYNEIFDKIEGKIESEENFICKRCEKAIPKIKNK